ncbi:flavodoxin [Alkalihalobacterium bogoriense]|uniref:flavodoxin n=1 Tax=Alkalihalobacterium bogoriense TaxID=246272 RepID=UPI000478736A|nr:flavodoxin [Alkalihalobacterium bogoriense]
MENVLLLFCSMSGNTEAIADVLEEGLAAEGVVVTKKDVLDVDASILLEYDAVVIGAYTWGDGELPDEFLDFYEEMENMDLSDKTFGVFGSGDTAYEIFCGAVDIIEERIKEQGGQIVVDGLKIEYEPIGEDIDLCKEFAKEFVVESKNKNTITK